MVVSILSRLVRVRVDDECDAGINVDDSSTVMRE